MGLMTRLAGRLGWVRQSSFAEEVRRILLGETRTRSGVLLSNDKALQVATVLACVRVIAEGLGALPCQLRQRTEAGSEAVTTQPAGWLLDVPNDWMTWQELVETLTMHAALTGNGFALIQRNLRGEPIALLPLQPGWVTWAQGRDWVVSYTVTWPDGSRMPVGFADMFHLRGPSWNGVAGLEVVKLAREAIGLAAAIEQTQAGHFGNGGHVSGILSSDQNVTKEQAAAWKERWKEAYGGDQAGSIAALGNGAKFQAIQFDFVNAQTLEARRLQVEEICRALRVFPQMIGAGDKATTYASAEAFFTGHAVHTLGPWAVRWEQTLARDLLTPRQRERLFFKITMQALLRADYKGRTEAYAKAIQMGWMTRNEARRLEDMNALPGLDEPLAPLNLGPGTGAPETAPAADPPAAPSV